MAASSLAQQAAGRFLLCHRSADELISSVVTNAITYGCQWARIHMQSCLSSPTVQFKGFVSLVGV